MKAATNRWWKEIFIFCVLHRFYSLTQVDGTLFGSRWWWARDLIICIELERCSERRRWKRRISEQQTLNLVSLFSFHPSALVTQMSCLDTLLRFLPLLFGCLAFYDQVINLHKICPLIRDDLCPTIRSRYTNIFYCRVNRIWLLVMRAQISQQADTTRASTLSGTQRRIYLNNNDFNDFVYVAASRCSSVHLSFLTLSSFQFCTFLFSFLICPPFCNEWVLMCAASTESGTTVYRTWKKTSRASRNVCLLLDDRQSSCARFAKR